MNEPSETLDFSADEINEIKVKIPKPRREDFRQARPKERALLVIFLLDADCDESDIDLIIPTCAISFPNSPNAKSIQFTVNSIEGNEDVEDED